MGTTTTDFMILAENAPMIDIMFICIVIIALHHLIDMLRPFAKIRIKDVRSPFK